MIVSLLVLALAPIGALFLLFYVRDRYSEPLFPLIMTFLLGAGALLPAVGTSLLLESLTGWTSHSKSMLDLFLAALVVVGLAEEGWKFLVVRLYSWRRREFDEPYDGIMYSVTASLGFATVENILYVLSGGQGAAVLRGLLAVPSHAFYGVLMGYFLGEAKFASTRGRSVGYSLAGLGLAILAHAVYDFMVFALTRRPLMLLVLPVFAILTWVIILRATKRQAAKSPQRSPALAALQGTVITPGPGTADSTQRHEGHKSTGKRQG
jgi:RsiW-degrading membrane proteinase PrsW (M82 family)